MLGATISAIWSRAEEARMARVRDKAMSDFEIEKNRSDFEVARRKGDGQPAISPEMREAIERRETPEPTARLTLAIAGHQRDELTLLLTIGAHPTRLVMTPRVAALLVTEVVRALAAR